MTEGHTGSTTGGVRPQPPLSERPGSQEYLPLAEADELLRFHPRTLLKYVRRSELQGRVIGRLNSVTNRREARDCVTVD